MKKILIATYLFLLSTASAAAQELDTLPMYNISWCTAVEYYSEYVLKNHGEIPILTGQGTISVVNSDETMGFADGFVVITANSQTRTFSVNIVFADGINCTLTAGIEFAPIVAAR